MPAITAPNDIPTPKILKQKMQYFRGVDLTNQPANVDKGRASNGINMIRDVPGKMRKRMGYYLLHSYGEAINGIFEYNNEIIVHSGTKLYKHDDEPVLITDEIADTKTTALKFGGKLYIFDGVKLRVYSDGTISNVESDAYVPTVSIGRAPNGGGQSYEAINLLSPMRKDSFLGTESDTNYQLSFETLASAAVTVELRDSNGDWTSYNESSGRFTVDRTTGVVTFSTAPGVSPVTGEDNILVTYSVDNTQNAERINKCRFSIAYGVNGAFDRIFASGNPDFPNYDWYCGLDDPTYWADLSYGVIGQQHAPIIGYSIINASLATHKQGEDNERNVILRYGALNDDSDPEFTLTGIIQGPGAIAPRTFGYAEEPIFLTAGGICATTPYIYNSERYVQNRSFYINAELTGEVGLEGSCACVYKDFYMLAVNNKVYILDTQGKQIENSIRSDYQYDAYLWDNIPASVIVSIGDKLFFGSDEGNLYCFHTDPEMMQSFSDNGSPIAARWEFDFSGENFNLKKALQYFSIQVAPASQANCEVWVRKDNTWKKYITSRDNKATYLDFDNIDFDNFTFNTDKFPITIGKKVKVKKFDTITISIRNEDINQSFGFYEIAIDFIESGYYKGGF